jgi:hypothetical protein
MRRIGYATFGVFQGTEVGAVGPPRRATSQCTPALRARRSPSRPGPHLIAARPPAGRPHLHLPPAHTTPHACAMCYA